MLNKLKNAILFMIVIAPDGFGALLLFIFIELFFQVYVYLGYGNPELKFFFIKFGIGLFFVFFVCRLGLYFIKRKFKN